MPSPNEESSSFPGRLQRHLEQWRLSVDGSRRRMWNHWTEGIHPSYRTLAEEMVRADSVKLHRYAAHVRSSQAFGFNLFLPFRQGSRMRLSGLVSEVIGTPLSVEEVRFEWVPPGALLGEISGERPTARETATAVDVVLWCRMEAGQTAVVLLEVKLSETEFTPCKGRTSSANRRTDVCRVGCSVL